MSDTPSHTPAPAAAAPRNLELKAALLLALMVALVAGAVLYLMYARGAFEATQRLVLIVDDSEGVRVGMDMTFSGFPVGRVRSIELGADGNARILIDVPRKDAHWLRQSSVFTLVRGVVGNTAIRAYSGVLTDPPLPDGAERRVLVGDATAEIPRLLASARELAQNLATMTSEQSALAGSLGNVHVATERLRGPHGALGLLMGSDEDAKKLLATLERTNALLAKLDGMAAHADRQVFGPQGLTSDVKQSVAQLNGLLAEARGTLTKVDGVLAEAQGAASNVKAATADLGPLRTEVETSLRKVQLLMDEINRKWPFARDTEIKLP